MKHVIFLVHGTWGKSADGWYISEEDESFRSALAEAIDQSSIAGSDIEYVPFEWEHNNSHKDRLDGAEKLGKMMFSMREDDPEVYFHLVAHSHGGNVVLKALELYLGRIQHGIQFTGGLGKAPEFYEYLLERFTENSFCTAAEQQAVNDHKRSIRSGIKSYDLEKHKGLAGVLNSQNLNQRRRFRKEVKGEMLSLARYQQFHRIASVVTMGTPFYFKRWEVTKLNQFLDRIIKTLSAIVMGFLMGYFAVLFYASVAALIPGINFIGFNFLNWHWALQLFAAILFVATSLGMFTEIAERAKDTNMYFDETKLGPLLSAPGGKLFRTFSVHASYLDEAFSTLKAVTEVEPLVHRAITNFTQPRIWVFSTRQEVAGTSTSVLNIVRTVLRRIVKFVISIVFMFAYPFRYLVNIVASFFAKRQIATNVSEFAYGLPADELIEAKTQVVNVLNAEYIYSIDLDATQFLSRLSINMEEEVGRFDFLWDGDALKTKFEGSKIKELYEEEAPLTHDQKKHLLAIEERAKEFFGVSGLRHSMYYQSPRVIQEIAKFIARD